jgi:hypothetical protein
MIIMKNKMTIAIMAGMLLIVLAQSASADVIMPGYHNLHIINNITNINDFPDYVFVSSGELGENVNTGMCPMSIVSDDGIIPGAYKFCQFSVYAIKKSEFAEFNRTLEGFALEMSEADIAGTKNFNFTKYSEDYKEYLSAHSAKVIDGVDIYESVPDSDTRTRVVNEYTIDKNLIALHEPTDITVKRSPMFYFYVIAPIVALALILWFLLRRKK